MSERIQAQAITSDSDLQSWLLRIMLTSIVLMAGFIGASAASEPPSIDGVVIFNRQLRGHNNSLMIPVGDLPPVGGVHHHQLQNCGIYLSPVVTEKAVHSLEHGAVWITYLPTLPKAEIEHLRGYVRGQEYMILSPFPGQRSPVVLTAWGVQLELDSANDPRLEQFIARYRLGPATPERGASCMGGFGNPSP